MRKILDDIGFRVKAYSADEFREYIVKVLNEESDDRIDFFRFARTFIESVKDKKPGTAGNHRVAINNLARFVGKEPLDINDITSLFLNRYQKWMDIERGAERGVGRKAEEGAERVDEASRRAAGRSGKKKR
ncbi:MAG: phage integrase SAM-like domain-containing protein [Prevotellaceae bacterium]|nr:phage integrase SAM-like domain-containing protein [Prevotellaceae bacterium]